MIAEQQGHRVVAMLLRQKAGKVTLGLDRHGLGFRAQVLGFREYRAPAVLYEARQEWQGHCRNPQGPSAHFLASSKPQPLNLKP